jgi:Protein of unknown function (DUF4239)
LSSLVIAGIAFACILGGTLVGMLLARLLPAHHLSGDSKDAVKQGLALIATLTALVLGLLVATKGTFDTQSTAVKEVSANVVLLDRVLGLYGLEAKEARESLANVVKIMLEQTWPEGDANPSNLAAPDVRVAGEVLFDKILTLEPKTDAQRMLKARALEITISLGQTRQRLLAQKESSIPLPFLFVLGFWLTVLFACYGLLAPRNLTVFIILVVCMLSVSGALFLVLEMDRPFDGIVRVSSAPLRAALSRLGD